MKSSNQKRRRISNRIRRFRMRKKRNIGMSGERSVKRRVENYTPVGSKRICLRTLSYKGEGDLHSSSRMEGCSCELP